MMLIGIGTTTHFVSSLSKLINTPTWPHFTNNHCVFKIANPIRYSYSHKKISDKTIARVGGQDRSSKETNDEFNDETVRKRKGLSFYGRVGMIYTKP